MRPPREPFFQASLEELSTPDGAVCTVAGPVEGNPDHALFCGTFVVREAARDVRPVVLDADSREPGFLQLTGVFGGQVLGMQIVGDQLRAHVEEPAIMLDSFPERAQRLVVLHVPDVVAHEGVAVSDQADRVLELSTAGQSVTAEVRGQPERCRGVATGATDLVRSSSRCTDHGVVAAHVDLTVVDKEVVGDLAQLIQCFLVAIGDGLVRVVAAGHDERDARVAQKQVVQRRVGEHHAQGFLARGYLFGDTGPLPTFQEDYGTCRRGEQRLFVRGDEADLTYLSEAACHEREGLVLAHLAAPQGPYSLLVERVAGQMVTAETLYGDDSPATQHLRGACNGVIRAVVKLVPEPVEQPYLRSADGAGVGLGVEAAVGGILVLAAAVGAHGKAGHRSPGA